MNMWTYTLGIPKYTKHWRLSFGSGTKLLLPSLSLGFRHEERETIFLCWLFVHRQLSIHWLNQRARTLQFITGPASPRSKNELASSKSKSQLTAFIQITKNPAHRFRAWRHSNPQFHFPTGVFYCDICDCHILPQAREYLHSMCAPN